MDSVKTKKVKRREFLKTAGMGVVGLGALPDLAKSAAAESSESDKSLYEQVTSLDIEEKDALTIFLRGLDVLDIAFTEELAVGYLGCTRLIAATYEKRDKEERAKQQERKHRDSLTGQKKADYFLGKLAECLRFYVPPFQQEVLEFIAKGEPSAPDWKDAHDSAVYAVGLVNECFEGTNKRFQQKIITRYLNDVWPVQEAEHEKDEVMQEAYDELLALTDDKTAEQVRAMTAKLKAVA